MEKVRKPKEHENQDVQQFANTNLFTFGGTRFRKQVDFVRVVLKNDKQRTAHKSLKHEHADTDPHRNRHTHTHTHTHTHQNPLSQPLRHPPTPTQNTKIPCPKPRHHCRKHPETRPCLRQFRPDGNVTTPIKHHLRQPTCKTQTPSLMQTDAISADCR
jgi:hypothetical protein